MLSMSCTMFLLQIPSVWLRDRPPRWVSWFYTWKKQCAGISLRGEMDSQYLKPERQRKFPKSAHCIQIQTRSNSQIQISDGQIMPETLMLGLTLVTGLTMMAGHRPSCLVTLKNPESLLNTQPTATLSQVKSIWHCFPWNRSPFLQPRPCRPGY